MHKKNSKLVFSSSFSLMDCPTADESEESTSVPEDSTPTFTGSNNASPHGSGYLAPGTSQTILPRTVPSIADGGFLLSPNNRM